MVSEEGLNAYGAVTWGQFFVYQGFNEYCGWMHTSSMADGTDLYADYLIEKNKQFFTTYDDSLKPVQQKQLSFRSKRNDSFGDYSLPAYVTHHGPVVGKTPDGKLLSLKTFHDPLRSLQQSWQRTKAKNLAEFTDIMQLRTNTSTNTVYADKEGNIAYWHGNFIPKRDPKYDWTQPVDGSHAKTAWNGAHDLKEIVHVVNPQQGFIQNCNSSPFHVSGMNSIDQKSYPVYMAPDGENFRSLFAIKELEKENSYTIDKMIALGYSRYLSAFDSLLPPLFNAYQNLAANDPLQKEMFAQINMLKNWDRKSSITSSATTLAILWAYNILQKASPELAGESSNSQSEWMTAIAKNTAPQNLLISLQETTQQLTSLFGSWQVPWGNINRYQRNAKGNFDDNKESLPVGLASAIFGSLPSFEPVWYKTSKGYGTAGNSFVAAVEFGDRIKAKAIIPGGQSFNPSSKHFNDQAERYITGNLRDVFFYRDDVEKHKEKKYKPGE
ncbi:MAG: acylase [Chitinophagaceae bacterium]|nr:MAG: acylase [Chitinophagaceae bacterium]